MRDARAISWREVVRVAVMTWMVILGLGALPGCAETSPIEFVRPRPVQSVTDRLGQTLIDKIDLLLTIDNSRSMADKHEILALAIPDLVNRLVNPRCVDKKGSPAAQQPNDPLAACPTAGTKREFAPILDIHIGVITSSIGGHGADACDAKKIGIGISIGPPKVALGQWAVQGT